MTDRNMESTEKFLEVSEQCDPGLGSLTNKENGNDVKLKEVEKSSNIHSEFVERENCTVEDLEQNIKNNLENSKCLKENVVNDHTMQSPESLVKSNSTLNNSSLNTQFGDITEANTDSNANVKKFELDEQEAEFKQDSPQSSDHLLNDQNVDKEDSDFKSHKVDTEKKLESNLVSVVEKSYEPCLEKSCDKSFIDSTKEICSIDGNEQAQLIDATTDEDNNFDTMKPVIVEVKSIAPEALITLDTDEIQDIKIQPEDTKVENMDTDSNKKMGRFEEGNKEESNSSKVQLNSFIVKSELIDEEENKTNENNMADEMEIDEDLEKLYKFESKGHESFLSNNHKKENIDDLEDSIFIEDCKPGITSKSDKSFLKEGSAEILLSSPKNVFYNPVQEFNRDMSVAALMVFSEDHQTDPRYKDRGVKRKKNFESELADEKKEDLLSVTPVAGTRFENGITILEALSATGLRSIRYAKEVPGVKQIIANDISEAAVENIKKNAEHNGVGDLIVTSKSDASLLMYQHLSKEEWYDAIDLDPYGCPSRFLDAAVQAVRDGGILLVTCTDMAVLAGNSPETCHTKYGAVSLRNPACHEMALRIALQCIESHANRYGRYIVPLLSFSADFYIRVIVQVYTSPVTCKKTTSKLSMVYQCVGCQAMTLSPLGLATQVGSNNQMKFSLPKSPPVNMCCSHCFYQHIVGGPIWSAPIHKTSFVERMLRVAETHQFGTSKRMEGMLEVIREELADVPLYYTISGLCSKIHCTAISLIDFRSALLNAGYRVSLSHASPNSVKTNAPVKTLWDIIRYWVQLNPISQRRLSEGSVSAAILFQEPSIVVNFERHPKARPNSRMRGLLRFQQNPQKNWGPGTRSRANVGDNLDERRIAKQNKKSKRTPVEIIEVITLSNDEEDTINT